MYDVIIKNGTIIDGTNQPMYKADLGIKKERIAKIGDLHNEAAQTIVDATGQFVAPGFIDIHNHSDGYWTLFNYRTLDSLARQGVTTIMGGGSGTSLAPLASPETIMAIRRWTNVDEITVNWLTMAEFLDELEKMGLSLNYGTMVGHITVKRGLLKDEVRDFTEEEYTIAENMLAQAMDEGAFGMSMGLSYSHAHFAKTEEIVRLSKIAAKKNGICTMALRDEGSGLLDSVKEAIVVAKEANVSLEITQFKAKGKENTKLFGQALDLLGQAVDDGLNINFDLYPYHTTGTVLYTYLPEWAAEGGRAKMLERLKNPNVRPKIVAEMKADEHKYDGLRVAMSGNLSYVGKDITEIGADENVGPEEAVINTLIASNGQAICFDPAIDKENVKRGLANHLSIVSSDGSGYSDKYAQTGNLVHPRCFGTFPKFLGEYVRDNKLMTWEEAVYKITGMPARKLGLRERGFLKKDLQADVVVFDPETIKDTATFENPYRYPHGISEVLVNGEFVVRRENHTGKLAGQVLRSN